jgi:hypothetical protein
VRERRSSERAIEQVRERWSGGVSEGVAEIAWIGTVCVRGVGCS